MASAEAVRRADEAAREASATAERFTQLSNRKLAVEEELRGVGDGAAWAGMIGGVEERLRVLQKGRGRWLQLGQELEDTRARGISVVDDLDASGTTLEELELQLSRFEPLGSKQRGPRRAARGSSSIDRQSGSTWSNLFRCGRTLSTTPGPSRWLKRRTDCGQRPLLCHSTDHQIDGLAQALNGLRPNTPSWPARSASGGSSCCGRDLGRKLLQVEGDVARAEAAVGPASARVKSLGERERLAASTALPTRRVSNLEPNSRGKRPSRELESAGAVHLAGRAPGSGTPHASSFTSNFGRVSAGQGLQTNCRAQAAATGSAADARTEQESQAMSQRHLEQSEQVERKRAQLDDLLGGADPREVARELKERQTASRRALEELRKLMAELASQRSHLEGEQGVRAKRIRGMEAKATTLLERCQGHLEELGLAGRDELRARVLTTAEASRVVTLRDELKDRALALEAQRDALKRQLSELGSERPEALVGAAATGDPDQQTEQLVRHRLEVLLAGSML